MKKCSPNYVTTPCSPSKNGSILCCISQGSMSLFLLSPTTTLEDVCFGAQRLLQELDQHILKDYLIV